MADEPLPFGGLTAFVVEDEAIIAFMIEDMLNELGFAQVVHAPSVTKAFVALETVQPDVAILDVNVAGTPVYPVAEKLLARGVPLAFASGYGRGGLSTEWSNATVIQKPFDLMRLREGLTTCLGQNGLAPHRI
jgi:DNA-binding response OmpR family regulator